MALLAMLTVPALAQCPAPGSLATVTFSEGATLLAGSTSASFPWLAGQGVDLFPPGQADTWLKCAAWWSLGPDRQVNAGESVGVQCDTDVCDVYAFLYHEPPRSSATNGALPAVLPPAGWTPGSCAPTFSDPSSPNHCRMTAFRKQMVDSETTTIDIAAGQPAMYLVVAVAPGVKCDENSLNANEGACEASEPFLAKSCAWEGGACVDKWCKNTRPATAPAVPPTAPPQCSATLSTVGSVELQSQVYSTGVDDGGVALLLNTPDTHWQVKADSGPWVQPLYAHTNKWLVGSTHDHPYLEDTPWNVGLPPSKPLAHPDYWFTSGKTASSPGTLFSWKQTFNVPAGAVGSYILWYRAGWDDASLTPSGSVGNSETCDHTVWLNGVPEVKDAIAISISSPDLKTECLGTISGSWVAGANTIEFRIKNIGSYYGFRFIVLPPLPTHNVS